MGYSNGTYTRNHNFSADGSAGVNILAARIDTEFDDLASALTNVVWTRDGATVPTVDIPMGGRKHINVAAATSVGNYMRVREFIEDVPIFMQDQESSADRISVSAQYFTSVSANQAPGDGTRILVRAGSDKSSAVMYLNGHSANVEFQGGSRAVNALVSGGIYEMIFSSADIVWRVTNPSHGRTAAERAAGVTPTSFQYPELHVERYGADPSGVADSATAFSNAASVAAATQRNGAHVILGHGTYKLSSLVTSPGRVLFVGQGMNVTRINIGTGVNGFKFVNDTATNEIEGGGILDCSISHDACTIVIECVDVWGLRFERIFFRDGGTGSGRLIKGSGECFEMRIRDCRMLGADTYCIDLLANCNSSIIEGCDFAPNDGCTTIRIQTAGDCVIRANRFEYAGSDTGVKVEVDAAKNTIICENDITQGTSGYAIVFKNDCDGCAVYGNQFNTSGSGGCIDVQNGDYGIIALNNFWISSTSGDQIVAGGRTGWVVQGNTFRVDAALDASANLVLIDESASDWAIVGNEFVGEGSGDDAGTAIQINSGSTQIKVIGNGFNGLNAAIDTQANNASPSVVIAENSFANLSTKVTVGTAASNVIKDNIGYRTQNKGSGAIANGATSATITHGLDVTPVAGDISLTPTNNPTNTPGNIWVDNITSTQFQVNCENDPGASTLTFHWRADCVS